MEKLLNQHKFHNFGRDPPHDASHKMNSAELKMIFLVLIECTYINRKFCMVDYNYYLHVCPLFMIDDLP